MRLDHGALFLLAFGSACAPPSRAARAPAAALPQLHAAAVDGPFPDEATLCKTLYAAGPDCLQRSGNFVSGPTVAEGLDRVEIVEAWSGDHRCAILFHVADRLYIHTAPSFCTSRGHSLYMPTVREMAFRDLDGLTTPDLVIIADVDIARDETEGAPVTTPPIPPLTIAVFCGRRGGDSPACVEVTTDVPETFVSTHAFRFD